MQTELKREERLMKWYNFH